MEMAVCPGLGKVELVSLSSESWVKTKAKPLSRKVSQSRLE